MGDQQPRAPSPPPRVAVVVPVCNGESTIAACVQSILACRYADLTLVVVDDGSSDGTARELAGLASPQLRLLTHPRPLGPSEARNRGCREVQADVFFFTDGDCVVDPGWIEAGLAALQQPDVVGVEGPVLYACAEPSGRHRLPINPFYRRPHLPRLNTPRRDFAACNVAYRADVLGALGGFNAARYPNGREDTDLGWRALRHGSIVHAPRMVVTHAEQLWTWLSLRDNARRYQQDVVFLKDHGFFFFHRGGVLHPRLLWMTLFPPALLAQLSCRSLSTLGFLPQAYLYLLTLRLNIWRAALRERLPVL